MMPEILHSFTSFYKNFTFTRSSVKAKSHILHLELFLYLAYFLNYWSANTKEREGALLLVFPCITKIDYYLKFDKFNKRMKINKFFDAFLMM